MPNKFNDFEYIFMEKLKYNSEFRKQFFNYPKETLENLLSQFYGRKILLNNDTVVIPINENSNYLYISVPPYMDQTVSQKFNKQSALEEILSILGPNKFYGMFVGELNNIWFRIGLHEGSSKSDAFKEINYANYCKNNK
jgi:hypothetical protein